MREDDRSYAIRSCFSGGRKGDGNGSVRSMVAKAMARRKGYAEDRREDDIEFLMCNIYVVQSIRDFLIPYIIVCYMCIPH
jgi:hypothetical protein